MALTLETIIKWRKLSKFSSPTAKFKITQGWMEGNNLNLVTETWFQLTNKIK